MSGVIINWLQVQRAWRLANCTGVSGLTFLARCFNKHILCHSASNVIRVLLLCPICALPVSLSSHSVGWQEGFHIYSRELFGQRGKKKKKNSTQTVRKYEYLNLGIINQLSKLAAVFCKISIKLNKCTYLISKHAIQVKKPREGVIIWE